MKKSTLLILTIGLVFSVLPETFAAKRIFITIGTGGVTGVYYPTGGAICRLVNQGKRLHGIRCNVESTQGSEYNANMIQAGELDLGIVQSDLGFKAWMGQSPFLQKMDKIRSVFSIHPESLSLVTRKDSEISNLKAIKGKKINLGNPGSGQLRTTSDLLGACGIRKSDLALAGSLKAAEMPDALRDKKLDGYFYVVGHPTANIKDISTSIDIFLTPITGKCVDRLIEEKPYYVKATIPGGMYRGAEKPVPTFGVKATLLASADVPQSVIYELVKSIFENLDEFKTLHPAYRNLNPKQMLEGLSAPLHPGALKYFKEMNWK